MGIDSAKTAILRAALTIRHWNDVPHDCETMGDLQLAFTQAGVAISTDQLRRWRDQGLMPKVKQVGLGQAAGSVIEYPNGTAQLAIKIHSLLTVRKKASFVGWQLWMQGYDVDQSFWKSHLETAANELKRIPAWLRLREIEHKSDSETMFDSVPKRSFAGTLFAKGLARLAPDMAAFVLSVLADVAKGTFENSNLQDQAQTVKERKALQQFVGQPANSVVGNVRIDEQFSSDLQGKLSDVSRLLAEIQKLPLSQTIDRAVAERRSFLEFLDIGAKLALSSDSRNKGHLGKYAKALLSDPNVQAHALIIWSAGQSKGIDLGFN